MNKDKLIRKLKLLLEVMKPYPKHYLVDHGGATFTTEDIKTLIKWAKNGDLNHSLLPEHMRYCNKIWKQVIEDRRR